MAAALFAAAFGALQHTAAPARGLEICSRGAPRAPAPCMASGMDRRRLLAGAAALGTVGASPREARAGFEGAEWALWPALPLAPYGKRKTLRREAGPRVWTFEQMLGVFYVHVPIRMTVVAMESGGLFVYAPVNLLQGTPQCRPGHTIPTADRRPPTADR